MANSKQDGFTYIEIMCALVILVIGILAQISALTLSMVRQDDAAKAAIARQIASSTLESIFAVRELGLQGDLKTFSRINNTGTEDGIFLTGRNPIREDAGKDGIQGTADDACIINQICTNQDYQNTSKVFENYEREIIITDLNENDIKGKKKLIEVKVSYYIGTIRKEQTLSTIIANLYFDKLFDAKKTNSSMPS